MGKFLFLEGKHGKNNDLEYASCVAKEIAQKIRELGHEVMEVESPYPEDANNAIQNFKPDVVWWVGHGSECATTLEKLSLWISVPPSITKNPDILNNTIANALSCLTGVTLGPTLTREHGCISYLGYEETFIFFGCKYSDCPCGVPKPPEAQIIRDEIWYPAFKCMHEANLYFCYGLAQGMKTGEANQYSKDRFTYWINYFNNIEPQNEYEMGLIANVVTILYWDRNAQGLYGNPDARITPAPTPRVLPLLAMLALPVMLVGLTYIPRMEVKRR